MEKKTTNIILMGMLGGVVLGGLLGYVWPEGLLATRFIGVLFLNALKVIIIPLIVASMIVGVTAMGDIRKVGRIGVKVIVYFLITTTIAVTIGLVLVNLFDPGEGVSTAGAALSEGMAGAQERSITDIFEALIPSNLIAAMANGKFLGVIIFSLVFGGVLTTLGPKAKTIINFFRELNEVVMKMVFLILYAAPIGLFSVVGTIVAENSDSVSQLGQSLFFYGLTLIIGLLIHGTIILPLILKLFSGRSPLQYATNMLPAFATAVGTSSSSATLPVTYECVVDKNKVEPRAGQFVLPLGTTVNMDGTAMYVVIATIFIAQAYGVALGALEMIMIGITAVLVSIGAAGIPSAALFMLAIVFGVAGFPEQAYAGVGLILAVDWFLDRCRTTVNVWGDSVGAAVIGESFEFKTTRGRTNARTSARYQRSSRRGGTRISTDRSTGSPRIAAKPRSTARKGVASGSRTGRDRSTRRPANGPRGSRPARGGRERNKTISGEESSKPKQLSPFEITDSGEPVFDRKSGALTSSGSDRSKGNDDYPDHSQSSRKDTGEGVNHSQGSSRKTDARNIESEAAEERGERGRVSQSAAARDLANLSAQLGRVNSRSSESKDAHEGGFTADLTKSGDKKEGAVTESHRSGSPADDTGAGPSFGRSRTRKRLPASKKSSAHSESSADDSERKAEYDKDGITFGRNRRRRPD